MPCILIFQDTDIPSSISRENAGIFANFLYFSYNKTVSDCELPKSFKNVNVLPIYRIDLRLEERNYRPISILPTLSKICERIMHSQISTYFDKILSKYIFGFRQGYSSQLCLLVLIEKWKKE